MDKRIHQKQMFEANEKRMPFKKKNKVGVDTKEVPALCIRKKKKNYMYINYKATAIRQKSGWEIDADKNYIKKKEKSVKKSTKVDKYNTDIQFANEKNTAVDKATVLR